MRCVEIVQNLRLNPPQSGDIFTSPKICGSKIKWQLAIKIIDSIEESASKVFVKR